MCGSGDLPVYSIEAETIRDVQAAVRFACKHNLCLVVKSTGHDGLGRLTAPNSPHPCVKIPKCLINGWFLCWWREHGICSDNWEWSSYEHNLTTQSSIGTLYRQGTSSGSKKPRLVLCSSLKILRSEINNVMFGADNGAGNNVVLGLQLMLEALYQDSPEKVGPPDQCTRSSLTTEQQCNPIFFPFYCQPLTPMADFFDKWFQELWHLRKCE
ncbi:hypothetical protein DFH08DRAFT_804294 [Mycena albidolilacea]|uniref:FAD linked oxidase N-terminal domain-containing protein n=1 Tax=Mycena albidolilacea TaxID=1033008 RepID=A0AAD7ABL7_9AGAR|nr:hypothetical protein DFH08DRAFT_804294 [Mycena albidolilacea]